MMRNSLNYKYSIVISFLMLVSISSYAQGKPKKASISKELIADSLRMMANSVNKHLPMVLDSTRIWISTMAMGESFTFNYSLKIDTITNPVLEMKKNMHSYLINYIRTNPASVDLKRFKATLYFNFTFEDGTFLYRIKLLPEEYE